MGILSMDPQQQGLLAAAFAAMQASGPSRMPVSFGQVVGQAGTAGIGAAEAAAKAEAEQQVKDIALKKAKADLALQEGLQKGVGANGILGTGMNDPDMLEAVGTRLSLAGHPGGAGLIAQAQKIRAAKTGEAQMATMKSVAPVTPDPQEYEQSADQGTPEPVAKPGRPGIFGSLMESEIPQIAAQAKASQATLDSQQGNAIPPQHWADLQGKLAAQETALSNRNVTPNTHVVKDPNSSTGWSYKDLRSGKTLSTDAPPPAAAVQAQAAASFTPESIDQMAQRYRLDGTLPSLGMGGSGNLVRAKIINRATEMAQQSGNTGEAERLRQVGFKANQQALGQLEKQRNLVVAFEKNALANADLALAQSEKVDRVGSPAIDRWIQSGKKNVMGDVEVAKLDTAIRTFVNEYAKVTTSVTGGGVTSDSARKEIDDLLKSSQTKDQVRGVINFMKQEMKNREKAYAQQVDELKGSMNLIPKTPATPSQIEDLLKKYGPKATNG